MAGPWRQAFPADVYSARAARRFVEHTLVEAGHPELVEPASLLVSELVTNSVLHARSGPTLVVQHDGDGVRFEVHDGDGRLPTVKRYGPQAATGRGLRLVDGLAERWQAEATADGKMVWFRLAPGGDAGDVDARLAAALLGDLDDGPEGTE